MTSVARELSVETNDTKVWAGLAHVWVTFLGEGRILVRY